MSLNLIRHLEKPLAEIKAKPHSTEGMAAGPADTNIEDPFLAANSCISLIKGQATKLALLITNEPFTPSEIVQILRSMTTVPATGLVSTVQVCDPEKYTLMVRRDMALDAPRSWPRLATLIGTVPKDGRALQSNQKTGETTGILWSACDESARFNQERCPRPSDQEGRGAADRLQDTWGRAQGVGRRDGRRWRQRRIRQQRRCRADTQSPTGLSEIQNGSQHVPSGHGPHAGPPRRVHGIDGAHPQRRPQPHPPAARVVPQAAETGHHLLHGRH